MAHMHSALTFVVLLLCSLVMEPAITFVTAQDTDVKVQIEAESSGQSAANLELYLSENRMRLDISGDVSVISHSGDSPRMIIVQHPDQQYTDWGADQLRMIENLMQQVQNTSANPSAEDTTSDRLEFAQTGQTTQIGPWNAFEVKMDDSSGNRGTLWLTKDVDVGLLELLSRALDGASLLSSPLASGVGSAMNFQQFQALSEAQGLPEGHIVRVTSEAENGTTTVTMTNIETEPLPTELFNPPADYTQSDMPAIPGFSR